MRSNPFLIGLLLFGGALAAPSMLFAQGVGINNPTPNASALLDLTSTNKGLLVPRMTTAQRDAIPVPATSLLVFNTSTARFEYFDGAAWVPLVVPGWSLSGNAGTNPVTNFIGTTDAQALAFRTGGIERMRIGSGASTSVGINTAAPGHTLHVLFTLPNNINSAVMVETNQATSATNIGFRNSTNTSFSSLGMQSNGDFGLGLGCNFGGCGAGTEAFRVKANGNFGIGTPNALDRLHVVGNIRMVDGNQAAGRVMVSNAFGTGSWQALSAASVGGWGLTGNASTNPATNFIGTTDAQPLRFRTNNQFAGQLSTTNTGMVSLGLGAGLANTGTNNTFLGQGAGAANLASGNNTYVGTNAGAANTNGQQNVFIGRLAGGNGTTGSDNILIGNGAGLQNTANNNVMIGSFSGNANSTGGGNTFMGTQSGAATTTGGQNTFIGTGAGGTNTTGEKNTLIGNGASVGAVNLTNATAIGRASRVDASDALVLGSVAGINAATTTSRIGIGTTNPTERLHVAGRALLHDGFSADNAALLYRNNTDYMFIGPQSGSSANGGAIALYGSTNAVGGNTNGIDLNAPGGSVRLNHTGGNFEFRANSTSGYTATMELNDVGLQIGHNSNSRAINFLNGGGERMRIEANGNVGIGTTPTARLHVAGQIRIVDGNQAAGRVLVSDGSGTGSWQPPGGLSWGLLGNAGTNPGTNYLGTSDDQHLVLRVNSAELLRLNTAGRVEIGSNGTAAPVIVGIGSPRLWVASSTANEEKLMIQSSQNTATSSPAILSARSRGSVAAPTAIVSGDILANWITLGYGASAFLPSGSIRITAENAPLTTHVPTRMDFSNDNMNVRMTIRSGGNIGIGTGNPATRLHIARGASGATVPLNTTLTLENNGANFQAFLSQSSSESGTLFVTDGGLRSSITYNNAAVPDGLLFRTDGTSDRMSITSTGNVGIATTAPAVKLHVNGAIAVTPAVASANAVTFNYAPGDRTYVRMGSSSTPTSRFVVLQAGLTPGQMLVIECTATGTNGLRFADGVGQNVSTSPRDLLAEDTITFIWNGTKWLEIGYANN